MKQITALLLVPVMLASCSVGEKRLIVISPDNTSVHTGERKITAAGKGHGEQTVVFREEGSVALQVSSPAGEGTVTLEGEGIFLLNTKTDTIIGSWSPYTAPKDSITKISEERLRADIDSLQQIMNGNVSAAKRTFFVLPNQAVKITENTKAHIVTPFHRMTSIEVKKGETPEVYRFYMMSEARTTLLRLKQMLGEGEQPVNQ